jgi:hypothetical protein
MRRSGSFEEARPEKSCDANASVSIADNPQLYVKMYALTASRDLSVAMASRLPFGDADGSVGL